MQSVVAGRQGSVHVRDSQMVGLGIFDSEEEGDVGEDVYQREAG